MYYFNINNVKINNNNNNNNKSIVRLLSDFSSNCSSPEEVLEYNSQWDGNRPETKSYADVADQLRGKSYEQYE